MKLAADQEDLRSGSLHANPARQGGVEIAALRDLTHWSRATVPPSASRVLLLRLGADHPAPVPDRGEARRDLHAQEHIGKGQHQQSQQNENHPQSHGADSAGRSKGFSAHLGRKLCGGGYSWSSRS